MALADEIAALERELAYYKAQGKTDRARQVEAALGRLRGPKAKKTTPTKRATAKVAGKTVATTATEPPETA